jgi:predicted permease
MGAELGYAVRALRRAPAFTLTTVLTLAVGFGATTTVFSLAKRIVIDPLPYPDADRLAVISHSAPGLGLHNAGTSDGIFLHYRANTHVFEELALYNENVVDLSGSQRPERIQVALVTSSFWATVNARPVVGRLHVPGDADVEPTPVVISHELWLRQYGGDPSVIGGTVELNRVPKQVVGVVDSRFDLPRPETDVWYASAPNTLTADVSGLHYMVIGRLRPDVSFDDAEADLNGLLPSLADGDPQAGVLLNDGGLRAVVEPLKSVVTGDIATSLWTLLAGVGMMLLIAYANLANLFLIRSEVRRKEIAVRCALGATRGDLVRRFLAESAIVSMLGGVIGAGMTYAAVGGLRATDAANLPRLSDVTVDVAVIGFAIALSLSAALLFAVIPAVRDGQPMLAALKEGGHATPGRERRRMHAALVAVQIALAMTLLVGSALLARTSWQLRRVDPGFEPRGVLTLQISLPYTPYPSFERLTEFWNRLLERVRVLPGVETAGAVTAVPLANDALGVFFRTGIGFDDETAGRDRDGATVDFRMVTPGYFETMRIPIVEGQLPQPGEPQASNPVLVSEPLARRFFPDGRAVGRQIRRVDEDGAAMPWNEIVGVVGGVREATLRSERGQTLYIPMLDRPVAGWYGPSYMTLAVRTSLRPNALVPDVRQVVRDIDPKLPVGNVRSMERIVTDSLRHANFTMLLLLVAAVAALLLGALGVYGIVSYSANQRAREIAIRMVLGQGATHVRRRLVRESARVLLPGIVAGAFVALGTARWLRSLLYGVSANDPTTYGAVAVLLAVVTLGAAYLPTRRAARVDPMVVLREE